MRRIYLDHTATTPLDPAVLEAMMPYFTGKFGNASSIHRFGQEARAALDESRERIASLIGAHAGEIVFVGSGTEADNFALKGAALKLRESGKDHIVTNRTEHHAVLETCEFLSRTGFSVTYVDVDKFGMVHPDDVRKAMVPTTGVVSIMHANNEVGTVNPIREIADIAHERGALLHTDAVQSFGKLPIDVGTIGADILSISAHKIYGPKGIGALFIRKGVAIEKFMHGGAQERGRRAGTENVPLAVGFAEAALRIHQAMDAESARLQQLRTTLRSYLCKRIPSIICNGHPDKCLPHIVNVSFDHHVMEIDGEALLFNLDMAGIAVTSGSACTSGSMEPSHVLLAMGIDPRTARATIRFSMGQSTTEADLTYTADTLAGIVQRMGTMKKKN